MKLVIERSDKDRIYAYFESERHHKKVNDARYAKQEVSPAQLDEECDLSVALPAGTFMVIPVSKRKLKRKNKCSAK
jgi:hypothetical protein